MHSSGDDPNPRIACETVDMRVGIVAHISLIRIADGLDLKPLAIWASEHMRHQCLRFVM